MQQVHAANSFKVLWKHCRISTNHLRNNTLVWHHSIDQHKWSSWPPDTIFPVYLLKNHQAFSFQTMWLNLKTSEGPVSLLNLIAFTLLSPFAFVMATSNNEILRMFKFFKRKVLLWYPFKCIVSQGMYFEKGQMVAFSRTSVTHHSFTEQPRCCWQLVCKSCWQFVQCLSCGDWGCPGHTIYQI